MHKGLLAAVTATTLFGAALFSGRADAMSASGAAAAQLAQAQLGTTEQVALICRRVFVDGFWVRRCFHDDDRVIIDRDRDFRRHDRDFRDRDRRRDCDRAGPVVVCH